VTGTAGSEKTPLDHGAGGQTAGTINPGVIWAGHLFQFGVEAVVPIISLRLPPLRERMDDLEKIALSHLTFLAGHAGKNVRGFSRDAVAAMRQYAWPGNLRELHNVIERAVILCSSQVIEADDLSDTIQTSSELRLGEKLTVHEIGTEHIRRVMASTHTLDEAARILGIDPATLYRKRKKL
jgi:two-component system, NtrC family, response regulator AlgB